MSVTTVDNTLTTQSGVKVKEANSPKKIFQKRKRNILTNCCKKRFKLPSNILAIFIA